MKVKIGFLVAMLLGNGPLSASTVPGLNPRTLESASVYIAIGKVESVKVLWDKGVNRRGYEASIKVITPLKGEIKTDGFRLVYHVGGVRGFGKLLKSGEHGVFFLRSLADGQGALTHSGSIALFDQGYIEP